MNKAMGRRMPVLVAEGDMRPKEPIQSAKFASQVGVVVRSELPILHHWKEYKKDDSYFKEFMGKLSVSTFTHSTMLH